MIVITGATGLVGRPLVDLLVDAGAPVRAVTRDPKSAALPDAVEVVEGDPSRPETLAEHLRGASAIFLNPAAIGAAAPELLALARSSGVRRAVAMSAINVDWELDRQPSRLTGHYNKEVEAAAVGSGLEWAALRSGYYAVNTARSWAAQISAGDVVRSPYPEANWAPLHERDIAEVGARALLTDELLGSRPVLTGPQSLTQAEMVAAIGAAIGRPLRYEAVPAETAVQNLVRSGFPEGPARGFFALQAESYGQEGLVTDTVERVLGRPALSYAAWAVEHAADFEPVQR